MERVFQECQTYGGEMVRECGARCVCVHVPCELVHFLCVEWKVSWRTPRALPLFPPPYSMQDFKSFLDVVLALENRNSEASMRVCR